MKKFLTSKWLILIVVSIGLVVFNSLVFNVSVVNRNIVVGIGLDYEDEEYILYTQVVLPKNGGVASGGGNNYITLKAKAKNIDIAVDMIEKEQGVILSFAQAAILILGKTMLESGDLQLVDTFFMPYGVECDQYSILGEILECHADQNRMTKEEGIFMTLECNEIIIEVCINREDCKDACVQKQF